MGKINRSLCFVLCCIALFRPDGYGQHLLNGFEFSEAEFRESIVSVQNKYLHVRESFYYNAKGQKVYNNRGQDVEDIQKRSGCPLGCFWCGAYMFVLFDDMGVNPIKDLGVKNPLLVASWFGDASKIVYRQGKGNPRVGVLPKKGDVGRMFYSHIEMYNGDDWLKDIGRKRAKFGGGNTGGGTGIHGVHITERPISNVQFIANWISPYYSKLKENESSKSK